MRTPGHYPALWQVGSLLEPATEVHIAPFEPLIYLGHRKGTVLWIEQGVRKRVEFSEVALLVQQMSQRMISWQEAECCTQIL